MRNVTRLFGVACMAAAAGLTGARADDQKDAPFSDRDFVIKVGSCGLHEVALGKLAQTQGKSEDVKKFGERMVRDHGKAAEALKAAAQAAGVGVPVAMLDEHQKEVTRLKGLSGAEFDKTFAEHMVKDHEKAIALFEKASKHAENPKIKEFATKTLPTLREHLAEAKKLGKGSGAGAAAATPRP
jgi:putative membrane protein